MRKILLLLFVFCAAAALSYSQGIVRGKITDKNGETIIGATIVLKTNRSVGVVTDLDGNYSLRITDAAPQTLVISFISFNTVEETVNPLNGEVVVKNFVLETSSKEIKQVVVTAKAVRARDYYMEKIKTNSATTLEYVSTETMKKTGDFKVTAAVARVTGVSTNGSFITVRGIGDRYVKTAINGSRIPTLDPFTNNIKLDLFPASLVDNVLITKTASPDLPGDWAGAYLSIETKDYPENLSINVETSFGYNSRNTFKDYTSSQHSKTDWLGYDNGFREHSHTDFTSVILSPSQYQEFVALGLGSYYNSLGVTENTTWNDTYQKLGLVQLGLLAPALINDDNAFKSAKSLYLSGDYSAKAFSVVNAGAVKTGQSFADNWNTTTRKLPLDFSQSFSIGNQINLFGKPLGFIAGFRYGSSVLYDPKAITQRVYPVTGLLTSYREVQASKETNNWSALINLAYKFSPNHSIALLFMPNYSGVNSVNNGYDTINIKTTLAQFYEHRRQLVYQFKSEHYLTASKIKIESNASYTRGKSNAPDFKELVYKGKSTDATISLDPTNDPADRYYRYLTDNLFDSRISMELPIGKKPDLPRKIKLGGSYQYDKQTNDQYHYFFKHGNSAVYPQSNNIDEQLSLDNFAIHDNALIWYYGQDVRPINHSFGNSTVGAGFLMLDYSIVPRVRVSGGVRAEQTIINTDIFQYDSLGYAKDDPRRNYQAGTPNANPGKIDELNYLPSANVIFKIINDDEAPFNLRLNYSQTIARPSIRELTDAQFFDYELQAPVTGNSELKLVHINNYDLRVEKYFKNNDNVSLSVFYKDFKNHIELEQSDTYYWQNVDKSHVAGIEAEGRKAFLKHFEFRANITLVNSTTTFVRTRKETVGSVTNIYYEDTVKRSMFGQAPYVVNGIVSYANDTLGLNLTLSYNVQGARLVIGSNNASIPDVYELPRNVFDFKAIKKLGRHFSTSVTVRDILNTSRTRSYKYDDHYTVFDKYSLGTSYVLALSYKL